VLDQQLLSPVIIIVIKIIIIIYVWRWSEVESTTAAIYWPIVPALDDTW
jgi:hypothetical protein